MKLFLVQWHYHDDTMICAITDNLEQAEEIKIKVEEGLKTKFFQGDDNRLNVYIEKRELNAIKCEEAGYP